MVGLKWRFVAKRFGRYFEWALKINGVELCNIILSSYLLIKIYEFSFNHKKTRVVIEDYDLELSFNLNILSRAFLIKIWSWAFMIKILSSTVTINIRSFLAHVDPWRLGAKILYKYFGFLHLNFTWCCTVPGFIVRKNSALFPYFFYTFRQGTFFYRKMQNFRNNHSISVSHCQPFH